MRSLTLTPDAKADLADIYEYTLKTWGRGQAEVYTLGLEGHLADLEHDVGHLRPIPERLGMFRSAYRSHQVIIRLLPTETKILRILHGRMDLLRHV